MRIRYPKLFLPSLTDPAVFSFSILPVAKIQVDLGYEGPAGIWIELVE